MYMLRGGSGSGADRYVRRACAFRAARTMIDRHAASAERHDSRDNPSHAVPCADSAVARRRDLPKSVCGLSTVMVGGVVVGVL
jgi:hypothetical protein